MEFYLLKIAESAESVRTLEFRKPSIFTNAFVHQPEITSLIHDADGAERALFTVPKNVHGNLDSNVVPERKPNNDATAHDASRWTRELLDGEHNVETMCAVVEKLAAVYPVTGVYQKLAQYRSKYSQLNDTIVNYEEIVEEQRQQLAQLNLTIESRDFEDAQRDPSEVERLIRETEMEVHKLEQELEVKQQEVRFLFSLLIG